MAKKKVAAIVRIQITAGQATPAPPVGTALGPHGINIMDFCKMYNSATESQRGTVVPAEITIFEDRSFTFITKTPPTPVLLRQAAGVEKGADNPRTTKVGSITKDQLQKIAETKMPDLNAIDIEGAMAQVKGTARSMGIEVKG
jgi:large subunit ribosomal protein L11